MPKMTRRLGSLTSLRGATPTSPDLARNFTNFRFNHLTQRSTLPARLGSNSTSWGPCNSSGRPDVSANAQTGQALGSGGMPWTDAGVTKVTE